MKRFLLFLLCLLAPALNAGDVPPAKVATFLKQFAAVHGQPGKVNVKDPAVVAAIKAMPGGPEITNDAIIVFCTTASEVKSWSAKKGHVTVVPRLDLMPAGGCLALVEENNLPKVYVRPDNYNEAGIELPKFMKQLGTPIK